MGIKVHVIKVSATGSAGSAVGSTNRSIGFVEVLAIHLNYTSAPSTTDVTITFPGNPAAVTVLTVINANSDAWFYPKFQDMGDTGAAITGSYSHPVVHNGNIDIAVAQGDAVVDIVTATILVRE